jgi:hypothetical protein
MVPDIVPTLAVVKFQVVPGSSFPAISLPETLIEYSVFPLNNELGRNVTVLPSQDRVPSTPSTITLTELSSIASEKATDTTDLVDSSLPVGDLLTTVGAMVSTTKVTSL